MTGAVTIVMPRLSDSMEEGDLVRWLRADGETIEAGDELAEIESDKAAIVYEAEEAGVLTRDIAEGDTVAVGAVIGWLGDRTRTTRRRTLRSPAEGVAGRAAYGARAWD